MNGNDPRRAVIVTARGVQDQEFIYPLYRLQEAGYQVDVATPDGRDCAGILGLKVSATHEIAELQEIEYDVLVIPGGVKAMEVLRLEPEAVAFAAAFHAAGKVIGCICSGAQLLISARLAKGRMISCYPAMRDDLENAGGEFHDGPVCDFDRIVTAPHYKHLGPWMAAVLAAVQRERRLADQA